MDTASKLRNLLRERVVFLDGATGTELQKIGMPAGVCTELWAMENQDAVRKMHREYAEAGADICLTCTFGGTLHSHGNSELVKKVNAGLARLALEEVGDRVIVAASIGPSGSVIYPHGDLRWIDACELFKVQIEALVSEGIDVFFLETFSDPREMKAAVLAIRDISPDAFISAQMTFSNEGLSLAGTLPTAFIVFTDQLEIDAVGANCSVGPESLLPVIQQMTGLTSKYVCVEPNAGLPVNGKYQMQPEEFARWAEDFTRAGVNIIGGCCGTGPDHIRKTVDLIGSSKPSERDVKPLRAFTSIDRVVPIGGKTLAVGEYINPTGKKALKKAIRSGDYLNVVSLALKQEQADLIDINLGLERLVPDGFVREVFSRLSTGIPVCVDLSTPCLIEEAFRELGGIGLLNSLTATESDIVSKIGILLRHGGYAVLLPIDEQGLGETPGQRLTKLEKGLAILREHGFPPERVIADPIVKAVSTGGRVEDTLATLQLFQEKGILTIAGVSNISHGLPGRRGLNNSMLAMMAGKKLDLAIIDVLESSTIEICRASQVLAGRVEPAEYAGISTEDETEKQEDPFEEVRRSLVKGDKHNVKLLVSKLIEQKVPPSEIIDKCLTGGMAQVGRLYSKRKLFLPHLIAAAEAAEALMQKIQPLLEKQETTSAGTVVIASVRGDIHDIGKNLVALFLRNSGFKVIDLGKDVSAEKIVDKAENSKADVIALSALMSTTAPGMEEVINLMRERGISGKVIVGGAVVTSDYADMIGADGYARDACSAVDIIKKLLNSN